MANARTDAGYSTAFRDQVKAMIKKQVESKFASTLGQAQDIVNLVAAQIYYESGYNVNSFGPSVSVAPRTSGNDYITSQVVVNKLDSGTPDERANVNQGLRAWGLGQVMGWNFIRKASSKNGQCEIERLRPDLAGTLCINAGQSIADHILGYSNLEKAITAQLVLLEGEYKNVVQESNGYTTKGDVEFRHYNTRIAAAFSGYIGLGKSDVNRTNPRSYAESICYGPTYAFVNGSNFSISNRVAQNNGNGPNTNGIDSERIVPPGC